MDKNMIIIKKKLTRNTILDVYVIPGERAEVHTITNGNLTNVKVFHPGDEARVDSSYNHCNISKIKSITAKNAIFSFDDQSGSSHKGTPKSLSWDKFAWSNTCCTTCTAKPCRGNCLG